MPVRRDEKVDRLWPAPRLRQALQPHALVRSPHVSPKVLRWQLPTVPRGAPPHAPRTLAPVQSPVGPCHPHPFFPLQVCGRRLNCKNHKCASPCHDGPCYFCTISTEVACPCGKTTMSVPCGREHRTRPPRCREPCRKPPYCHHASQVPHTCHDGNCPKCASWASGQGPDARWASIAWANLTSSVHWFRVLSVIGKMFCYEKLPCGHKCQAICHDKRPIVRGRLSRGCV